MAYLAGVSDKRAMAARARRMALNLTDETDKGRLIKYAEELDKEADELERAARPIKKPS
jgi:hypothetical protein